MITESQRPSQTPAQTPASDATRPRLSQRMAPRMRTLRHSARGLGLTLAGVMLDGVSAATRRLPLSARYAFSDRLVWALRPLLKRPQRAAAQNFARVVGSAAAEETAARSLRNYGRMAMDFLAARTLAPNEILALVEEGGLEHFRAALAHGHGAIFALPHAGSWDVAAIFAQAYGLKLTIVTESDWATELVAGSRRAHGVTLAPRDQSLRALFRALRRQECVVMLADITPPGVQTAEVPFFGAPARFPLGPARLAYATGAPVLVIESVRLANGRYRAAAQPPLIPDRAPDRTASHHDDTDGAVIRMTSEIALGFERIIRAHPDQWYPYHPIWEERPAR